MGWEKMSLWAAVLEEGKGKSCSGWGEVPRLGWGEGGETAGGVQTWPPEEHSVQKFLTPFPLPPLQLSPLLPSGRPGIWADFHAKKTS